VVAAPGIWGGSQFSILYHYNNRSVLDTLTNFAGEKATFASNPELMPAGTTLLGLNNLSIAFEYVWNHRSDELQLSDSTLNAPLGQVHLRPRRQPARSRSAGGRA